jgi:hypothetical protein
MGEEEYYDNEEYRGEEDFGEEDYGDEEPGQSPEQGFLDPEEHEMLGEEGGPPMQVGIYRDEQHSHTSLDESFEKNVNMMARAKANLLTMINDRRGELGLGVFFEDITLNQVATEMSGYLKDNEFSQKKLKEIIEYERVDFTPQLAYVVSRYDEDTVAHSKEDALAYFIEIGYLFFEIDAYKKQLEDPMLNHIGIGLAGNNKHIIVVYLFSSKALTITSITYTPETQRVDLRGRMLDASVGVYVLKLINGTAPADQKTYMQLVLPIKMTYSKASKEFTIWFECANPFKTRHFIEIYTRANPDSIGYGKQNGSKLDFKYFDMKMRALLVEFPEPNFKEALSELAEVRKREVKS